MLTPLRENFHLGSEYLRYALRLSVSCTLVVFLYVIMKLPNGYWAAFSVIACVFPTQGQSLVRSKQRMVGTFIGMCIGIVLAHSLGTNYFILDTLIAIFIFFAFYLKIYSYQLFAIFITILSVLFIVLIYPGDWEIGVIRLEMTILGAIIAIVATLVFLPTRASLSYPKQLTQLKHCLLAYYKAIMHQKSGQMKKIQQRLFGCFQQASALFKDAQGEYRIKISDTEYRHLYAIYKILLYLKVHHPKKINDPSLIPLWLALEKPINDITLLFQSPNQPQQTAILTTINQQLEKLLQLRITASSDLTIPTAIHYERMQMTVFLKSLRKLVGELG